MALRFLPLAEAIAIAFVLPFIMLLLGKFVLKEEVGARRLIACLVGFIGTLLANSRRDAAADRTAATVGATMVLAQRGIQIVRVHDVATVHDALVLFEACGGIDGNVARIE